MTTASSVSESALVSSKKKIRIALLGGTGAGKTSLIDLIHNYARLKGTIFDPEKIETYRDMRAEADTGDMESKTSECVIYSLVINEIEVEIIDTPGLYDTRGPEQIQANIDSIITFLKGLEHINCICLVINGAQPRINDSIRGAFDEILSILPKGVQNNVITVFTHNGSTKKLSFSTAKLKSELGFDIKSYCIENGYCSWRNSKERTPSHGEEEDDDDLERDLNRNFKMLDIIFDIIKSFSRIATNTFGDLHAVAESISLKYNTLRALCESKADLEKTIALIKKELLEATQNKVVWRSRLSYIRTNATETKEYNTICDASDCYSNCHAPCIFTGIMTKNVKTCACIQENGNCKKCSHHYSKHSHQKFVFKEEEIALRDGFREKLQEATTQADQQRVLLDEQEHQLAEAKYDENSIRLKSGIVILLAEFQRLSSKESYENIIDAEIARATSRLNRFLSGSKKELADVVGLGGYREGLVEIQNMPFTSEMSNEDKITWACNILDLPPDSIIRKSIDHAFRSISRRHRDIIKEGNEVIQRRHVHARDLLYHKLNLK